MKFKQKQKKNKNKTKKAKNQSIENWKDEQDGPHQTVVSTDRYIEYGSFEGRNIHYRIYKC
jgi:hypothetical protein